MKFRIVIFTIVIALFSLKSWSRSDSSYVFIPHKIGAELGSQYLYYTAYYEYQFQKGLNGFGLGIDGSYFPTSYPDNWEFGNGFRFNYLHGKKNNFLLMYGLGYVLNFDSMNNQFEDYSPQDRPRKKALYNSLSIGYQYNFNFGLSFYLKSIFMVESYYLLWPDAINTRLVNKYRIWGAFGVKFTFGKY